MSVSTAASPAPATTGTGLLLRLALRRDWLIASLCMAVLLLVCVASAAATPGLYPDEATRVRAADALNASPAIVALYGPILDPRSAGELAMTKLTVLYAVFVAVLFIVLVRRHTRVEEESGRAELVGGTAVGRDAPLAAATLEAVLLALLLGGLTAVANAAGGLPVGGSLAFGGVWAGTALVAAGVGALAAQLSASARSCAAYAAAAIGAFFVLRAAGDTGPGWVSWLSPLGWNTQVRAYSDTRWWLLLLYPLLATGLLAAARTLRAHRGLSAGLFPARPGRAAGSARLRGPVGLAVAEHATTLTLWTAAVAVLGVLFGMMTPAIGDLLDSALAQSVIDRLGGVLVAAILSVMAVVVSYFAASVVGHAGVEEDEGRLELVLATPVSRVRWFVATALLTAAGTTWLMAVTGLGVWTGYTIAGGPSVGNLLLAAVAWTPAAWVTIGLSVLCLAVRPGWADVAWAWPAAFVALQVVAESLELPRWVIKLSPYSHVPAMPAEAWSWSAMVDLTIVAAALAVLAGLRFRLRDIG